MNKLEKLKQENERVFELLAEAERRNDFDEGLKLKKQYYQNKLLMLELLNVKNEKLTLTARELKLKVNNKPKAIRYETGISILDKELRGGFEVGSLIQLAGQSFAGKTTLFLNIIANISKYTKASFFNFEMGDRRIVKRLNDLLTEEDQWDNLLINADTRNINDLIMEITILANDGIKFFAIDSRMKLRKDGSEAEYQKIALMSSMLSECAIKNDIIILMVNQISEEDLKSQRLSFKGSGDQLYDTDMALFILIKEDETRELQCIKNRQDEVTFKIDLPKTYRPTFQVTEYKHENVEMGVL